MIQAKIVADSIGPNGDRLTTMEIVFPRYILAELNTHRMLSKNSASSRAIPFSKMVQSVQDNPFIPYAFQKEHSGMQGMEYFTEEDDITYLTDMWIEGLNSAIERAKVLTNKEAFIDKKGLTKQLANRPLEPFMYHKVLVSGTEWENFFNLRCPSYALLDDEGNHIEKYAKSKKEWCNIMNDKGTNIHYTTDYTTLDWLKINKGQADIHMMFLAEAIYDAINESTPNKLKEGEWHIPYGDNFDLHKITTIASQISNEKGGGLPFETAIAEAKARISIARCARLSYQTLGDNPEVNYEKDLKLYDVLSTSGHWSPFEHVARCMTRDEYGSWLKGKREYDAEYTEYNILEDTFGWCRNYRGFIQIREILD